MTAPDLPHALERSLVIRAQRSTVFGYFTDSQRFARWWGPGSSIDARPGGRVTIRYPNAVVAQGEVREVVAGERIAFTYGYASGQPIGPGASLVTIALSDHPHGTLLELRHAFADASVRDAHVGGWRYQLAAFANVVAAEQHADLAAVADRYFAAWAERDAARRRAALEGCVTQDVEFRDAFGCTSGRDELAAHIAAAQQHMPGSALVRAGEPRQVQGMALVDWRATGPDGAPRGAGTNVLQLAPDGRIARVVGFRDAPG
jgi:uncharacterized protein YndB with AHSA1/START domain